MYTVSLNSLCREKVTIVMSPVNNILQHCDKNEMSHWPAKFVCCDWNTISNLFSHHRLLFVLTLG
jgi:hypothetical protein